MIRRIPCQDSDELLLVELRVETFSSAAFLLRDARDVHIGGAFFPTAFFSTDASRDSGVHLFPSSFVLRVHAMEEHGVLMAILHDLVTDTWHSLTRH